MEAKHQTKQPSLGHHGAEEPTCLPGQLPQGASCDPQDPERRGSVSHPQPTPNSPIRLEPAATTECAEKKGLVPGRKGARAPFRPPNVQGAPNSWGSKHGQPTCSCTCKRHPSRPPEAPSGVSAEEREPDEPPQSAARAALIGSSSRPLSAPLPTTHRRVQGFQASAALCPTPGVGG